MRMAEITKWEVESPLISSGAQNGSCSPSFSLAFSALAFPIWGCMPSENLSTCDDKKLITRLLLPSHPFPPSLLLLPTLISSHVPGR